MFSSVTQLCPTLCDPMDCSTPGLPVHHQLPEFTQTQVHWVSDAIQPFHPLSSPSPPAFNLSQHQGLFQWAHFSHQVAKVLKLYLQHQSFQWIFRTNFLLRNLYAGKEATVRTGHGTRHWFQIGKGVHQGCILSPCLFNLYAEYIMRNAGLDETQGGNKIPGRNINNLRYADDTSFMAESEKELKSLLVKVKEETEKVGLKLNIPKTKIMVSSPITSWQINGETVETVADFIFWGRLQNHCRWWLQPWN